MRNWPKFIAASFAFAAGGAGAQTLLETTATLGRTPEPVTLEFQVATAGNYRITLTDFGTAAGPVRMSRVDAGITRGSELVRAVNVTSASSTGVATATFAATAGTHRLVFVGRPAATATVGSAGVRVDEPSSGAVLLETLQIFRVPPPPVASPADFEYELDVPAGSYTLTITDFALPQALAALDAIVIRRSDGSAVSAQPGTPVALSAGSADTFEVFVHAELAQGAARGVAGVNLRDTASGATLRHEHMELGDWRYRYVFDVAAAAALTATLADLQFPAPLTALAAQIVRDGQAVGSRFAPSAGTTFAAVPGSYTLYVNAQESASPGSFGIDIRPPGGSAVFERIQNVVPVAPATDVGSIETFFDVTTAGDYRLTLTDFGTSGFFNPFTTINLGLTRDNQLLQSLTAPGSVAFAATPGRYRIAIVADPAGAAGEGLLGVRVRGEGDTVIYDRTEAVGADFLSYTIEPISTQSVDVRLTDLSFPADFDEIRVAVTRGADRVGEIFGAGVFTFQATPGTYIVNLLATPDAAVGYSTFGVRASTTPAAPVVSLAASATGITVGGSVTLTWTAQDADSCAASNGWSGSRPMTGTAPSGALQANTTFTLTCTGAGGSRDASVSVAVSAAQRSGGSGSSDAWLLLLLGGAAIVGRRRRLALGAAGTG